MLHNSKNTLNVEKSVLSTS